MISRGTVRRLGPTLLVLIAIASFGRGLIETRRDDQDRRSGLRIEAGDLSFGEVREGQEFLVTLPVTNDSAEEIQILGSTKHCTPEGCLEARELPVAIAPGATVAIEIGGTGAKFGPFRADIVLYTTDAGMPALPLQVVGRVISADR